MTEAQTKKRLAELLAEAEKIHADYLARFAELKREQLALLKKAKSGADINDIERLKNEIKKKHLK